MGDITLIVDTSSSLCYAIAVFGSNYFITLMSNEHTPNEQPYDGRADDFNVGVRSSILDTILGAEQLNQLQNFDPKGILRQMFDIIDERSRHILRRRYGF